MKLRFKERDISAIAARNQYLISEVELMEFRPSVLRRGYLLKKELEKLAYWKSPRSAGHIKGNDEDYVREISRVAFHTVSERARIEVLTVLEGVSWPTASVILHFFHKDPYPIMDFRALWSVSCNVPPQYKFDYWWMYVQFCRDLADRNAIDMRILDKALWQYSKENQKS